MKLFSFIILLVIICNPGHAQKAPIKYGDVSMEELQMTSCYLDSTAPAVVLCDYGYFRSVDFTFTRLVRIKILRKEGYDYANMIFESDIQSNLKGVTTNLENGKIVQEKLGKESIFETRVVNDQYVMRAAMPGVKVGSVIDYEFSFRGMLTQWKFQEDIPVIHSELIVENSRINFRTNFSGNERLTYSTPTRWIARDMPAFKMEPIMVGKENYITKITFDLVAFSSTWEKVNELLFESSYFAMPTASTSYLNELSGFLSKRYVKKEELLKAAYDTIRKKILWNESEQLFVSDGNLAGVYKMGAGNSAEINLLLYKLLKKLNFDAIPVALSTRDNGIISPYAPNIRKLNYAIVYLKIGDKEYFLDATEKYMPLYLLPSRCMNVQGRLIDKKTDQWVLLTNEKKTKDLIIHDLNIGEDLVLKGEISSILSDYSAFDFRKKYSKFNSHEEYLELCSTEMPGMVITDSKIENLDSVYKPLSEKKSVEISDQVTNIDNSIYVVPLYFGSIRENPFKLNTRKYPVNYVIPVEKTVILNLTVPEGFKVTLPPSIVFRLPGNSGFFMYEAISDQNKIRVTTKFAINKTAFTIEEYNDLKEFYNQVIKKQSEPLVIKKS